MLHTGEQSSRALRAGFACFLSVVVASACVPRGAASAPERGSIDAVAAELDGMSQGLTRRHHGTFRGILADTIAVDPYVCLPAARDVFFGPVPEGARMIAGSMPHYGLFFGPMRYLVRRGHGPGGGPRWEVRVTIAVELPPEGGSLELPDCELARALGGGDPAKVPGASCRGAPYASSRSTDACPRSGLFSLPATYANMRALLERWSREAEAYYERDAAAFGLPVSYDFTFAPADEVEPGRADLTVPLMRTCGRTPYYAGFRSGWSLPIVAHEVGHVLGLLDEYEALSGIFAFYPKTPFRGAEVSRMGLSMREGTRVLPLHHYLILRRYFCPEPDPRGFHGRAVL